MMSHIKVIVVVLCALLVVIVAVQNHNAFSSVVDLKIDLLFFNSETTMSLYFVTVIAFLCGILVAGLLGIAERFRLKREIGVLKRAAKEKDKELNSLRNLPVTGGSISHGQAPETETAV